MTGGSVGWQAGIQSTDVILVFRTRKGLESLFRNKLTLGVDAGVAAGPAGRQASAATDLAVQAEILSYSRSRGLFAGVALDGAAMALDSAANNRYYAAANPAGSTLPASAARLVATLTQYREPKAHRESWLRLLRNPFQFRSRSTEQSAGNENGGYPSAACAVEPRHEPGD